MPTWLCIPRCLALGEWFTPLWFSGSLRSFLHSSSVYSCHLFLISSASVRSILFLSFIVHISAWKFSLIALIFLKRYLVFPWRRQWHPTPVLLPGKSHGWRSLEGCSPWGRWGSGMTEWLHFPFSLSCIGEGNGNPLQCSGLESPRDGEPGGLPSMGSHRVGYDWSDLAAAQDCYEV